MLLIADSGSTKTDWRLIDGNKKIHQFSTQGLNPYFISSAGTIAELRSTLLPKVEEAGQVTKLFFYGSGTGAAEKRKQVHKTLTELFPGAVIEVNTDILGAARALSDGREGVISILGTGSNSCHFNGSGITAVSPSLGFILGDEGSGAHIGKTFVTALLNKEIPSDLEARFFERYKADRDILLDKIYHQPFPNRYLASFAKFVHQNLKNDQVAALVAGCFSDFLDKRIRPLMGDKPCALHCSGSIGFYFSNILQAVAQQKNVRMGRIVESPIAALALYHLEELK
jgi:glucosamine kinase